MEALKQRLLTQIGDSQNTEASMGDNSSSATGGASGDGGQSQQQFNELLALCRGDLGEILDKLRQKSQQDAQIED